MGQKQTDLIKKFTGKKAPGFNLPDQNGKAHSLKNYAGGWLVVYFYPKDDTPGCTKEACSIRDWIGDFKKAGVKVVGVSVDSVKSHKKFADKYHLNFIILADEDKATVNAYGVWAKKKFMGREYMGTMRTTFLIDPASKIRKVYENVKPDVHVDELLADVKIITKKK